MNRMKERAMRWVSAILPILLLILGMASPRSPPPDRLSS
jgi:hypothetical protein